ncbi:MEDS domain-containing protein [Actinomadura viridis]|uniref:Anti-anti-sigma regulatory factor n=1 Tax=Actinomadura viridis TaxID=58110 RepID=A0A931GUY7_9ACTN|nr:MEDS domain-containing protein [Actinomadura viridis]MBG6093679.1 anti-anti-sigma regulatory factor [Actinomadura viridis]
MSASFSHRVPPHGGADDRPAGAPPFPHRAVTRWASEFPGSPYSGLGRDDPGDQGAGASWFARRPVGAMRPGDHAWLAYSGTEERDRVIGTFVRDGLDNGEKVVYVTDTPPDLLPGMRRHGEPELLALMASRRLRVIPNRDACLDARGRFQPERMLETLARETGEAFGQGFRAVRLTTDHTWALNGPGRSGLARTLCCERLFADAISPSTMAMAVCQVARHSRPSGELAALRDTHEVLVEVDPEFDDGVLTLVRTFEPHGLRVEGELDSARHAVFADRLDQLIALRRPVHLDFSRLDFIDLGGINLLARHATAPHGTPALVLDGLPPDVEHVIELVGWHRLPGIARGRRRPATRQGALL